MMAQHIVTVNWDGDDISEDELKKIFARYSAYSVIKEQLPPGISRGSAYVSFRTQQEAEDAVNNTDGNVVGGSVIEVAISKVAVQRLQLQPLLQPQQIQQIPSQMNSYQQQIQPKAQLDTRKIQGSAQPLKLPSIIIKNLNRDTQDRDINSLLYTYNPIQIFILPDQSSSFGNSKAIVGFTNIDQASRACKMTNGALLKGNILSAEFTTEQIQDQPSPVEEKVNKKGLFIKNVSPLVTDRIIMLVFSPFNPKACRIMTSTQPQKPGLGFALFDYEEDAQDAMQLLNHASIEGTNIDIVFQRRDEKSPPLSPVRKRPQIQNAPLVGYGVNACSLYVTGINQKLTTKELTLIFTAFKVTKCAIPPKQLPTKAHFGFVDFASQEDAQLAYKYVNGIKIDGNVLQLQYNRVKHNSPPNIQYKSHQDIQISSSSSSPPVQSNKPTIILRNLSNDINTMNITIFLDNFHPQNITIKQDNLSLNNTLMAIVEFIDLGQAQGALNFANGSYLHGNTIQAELGPNQQINTNAHKSQSPSTYQNNISSNVSNNIINSNNSSNVSNNIINNISSNISSNFSSNTSSPINQTNTHQAFIQLKGKSKSLMDPKILFINNLSPMTTEVSLKQIFIAFNISNCRIPQNQPPKKPRHGFLNFSTEQDAQNALQSIQGKIIDGNRITINYKHIKQEKKPKVKKQQDIKGINGINNVDEQEYNQDDSDDDINDADDEKSLRSENLSSFKSEDEKKGSKFLDDLNEIMSVVSVDRVTVIRVYMEHGKDVAETINYLIDHPQ